MAGSEPAVEEARQAAYRSLLENARAMLAAAREERWEELSAMDAERRRCISRVAEADRISAGPPDAAAYAGLVQDILECDEQTGALVRAWQAEMAEVLGSMDNARKLAHAYGDG